MTEKRFTSDGTSLLNDGEFWLDGSVATICNAEEICELLNELYEENHQLERQVGNLEHTRDFCAECCERLEKENEQLKSEIREVRGAYEQLWMRFYDY